MISHKARLSTEIALYFRQTTPRISQTSSPDYYSSVTRTPPLHLYTTARDVLRLQERNWHKRQTGCLKLLRCGFTPHFPTKLVLVPCCKNQLRHCAPCKLSLPNPRAPSKASPATNTTQSHHHQFATKTFAAWTSEIASWSFSFLPLQRTSLIDVPSSIPTRLYCPSCTTITEEFHSTARRLCAASHRVLSSREAMGLASEPLPSRIKKRGAI